MEFTDEHMHDNKILPELIDGIAKSNNGFIVDSILADDASYDGNNTYSYISETKIMPGIKVRKNSRVRKTAQLFRNLSVIAQRKNDVQQWKDSMVC